MFKCVNKHDENGYFFKPVIIKGMKIHVLFFVGKGYDLCVKCHINVELLPFQKVETEWQTL